MHFKRLSERAFELRIEPMTATWRRGRFWPWMKSDPGSLLAFWLVFWIVVAIISLALTIYFLLNPASTQQDGPDNAKPGKFNVSTSTEDRLIPEIAGTVKVALNLLHIGSTEKEEIIQVTEVDTGKGGDEEIEQVVGHAIFVPLMYGLGGFGSIDSGTGKATSVLTGFYYQDELVWEGALTDNQTASVKTGQAASLNGSHYSRSTLRFRDGSQTSFPEYTARLGADISYFGTALAWFDRAFVGDNASSVPNYAVRLRRIHDELDPGGGKAGIADSETGLIGQNPADLLWHILTNYLEIDEFQIDKDSFLAAQATLYDEEFGLHVNFDEARTASDWINEVLRHIDGSLNLDATTGLWTLRLVRADYSVEDLPEIGPDRYRGLKLRRQAWEDIPTQIELKHLDLSKYEMASVPIENPSARWAVGATKKKSVAFPFAGTNAVVSLLQARLQRRYWKPLANVTLTVPANMTHPTTGLPWALQEGDVFKVRYDDPKKAISFSGLVVRVVGVAQGQGEAAITVEATEDLFSIGGITLLDPPPSVGSGGGLVLNDPPEYMFVADASPELASRAAFGVLASPPATGIASDFGVQIDDAYNYGPFPIAARAVLATAITADTPFGDLLAELTLSNPTANLEEFSTSNGAWMRLARPVVIEHPSTGDYEILSAKQLIDNGGGSWTLRGFLRDIGGSGWKADGSGKKAFPVGSPAWFLPSRTRIPIIPINGALTVSKKIEVHAQNYYDVGPPKSANKTYGFAVETPYPPGWLQREAIAGPGWRITWIPHTRHKGATGANIDNNPVFDAAPEGSWEVSIPAEPSVEPFFVTEPFFEVIVGVAPTKTYQVRSFLNGRFSAPRTIVVPGLVGL